MGRARPRGGALIDRLSRAGRALRRMLLAASLAGAGDVAGATFNAEQLMSLLAARPEAVIAFAEVRHSSLLSAPLVTTGELRFTPPATLERKVTAPFAERTVIEGDRVTIERPGAGTARILSLGSQPLLANLVGTLRALLRGDLPTLARIYRVELRGNPDDWALTLLPSDPAMVEYVATVHVRGRAGTLTDMEFVEPSGDRTVTRFTHPPGATR